MRYLIDFILVSLFGTAVGFGLGLLPGMHINNVLPVFISLSLFFSSPMHLTVFIISVAITQTFISYIPSIFLGAPEEETALSVLPGHKLLFEGRGYEAIKLTVIGAILSVFITLVFIFFFANYFSKLYGFSRPYIHYVISLVAIIMILSEKKIKRILSATLIFFMSGIFGVLSLNSPIVSQQNVLFPVLSGLFGLSLLLISFSQKSKIPVQQFDNQMNISKMNLFKSVILGSFAGVLVGMLPAIGVSQAATLVQYLGSTGEARNFLVTLSGINISNEIFSLVSLFLVNNPRSGASVAIEKILGGLSANDVVFFVGFICFSAGIAALITIFMAKRIPKYLEKINYQQLTFVIIVFLISMVMLMTGFGGLLILFTSVSIGLLCNFLGIRKSHCMGVLLLPSILFFAGLS